MGLDRGPLGALPSIGSWRAACPDCAEHCPLPKDATQQWARAG
jgi:hypothetical protein